jgi:hypothetical protein
MLWIDTDIADLCDLNFWKFEQNVYIFKFYLFSED